jgi:nitrate/nitrite transporter NarK
MNPDLQQSDGGNKNRAANIVLIMLCMSFQPLAQTAIALFLPIIQDVLEISFSKAGTLSAVGIFVYALVQIPSGYLADRLGLKKIFFIGILGTTVLCFAFGLISTYWQALLNQALTGLFRAFLFASGLALLTSWFGPQRRATAMGLSPIGLFSGPLVMNFLGPSLESHFNWRFPFMSFASVGVLSAFAFLWFGKDSLQTETGPKVRLGDVYQLFRFPFMWVCAVIQFVRLGVLNGLTFWLPSYLINERGFSLQTTGLILSIRLLIMAPSNIMGGYISDRLKNPTLVIGGSLVMIAITTALFVVVENRGLLVFLVYINALFIMLYFGPLFAAPVEKYGSHMTGTITGFSNFFANLGGFTFTYLLGLLKEETGFFKPGFYTLASACVVGLFFTIMLERIRRKDTPTKGRDFSTPY